MAGGEEVVKSDNSQICENEDEGLAAQAAIASSAGLWFATCARILTKDQRLTVPDPNGYQMRMLEAYEWCLAQGVPLRLLALKPRQKGSSTVSSAVVYHHCRRFPARALQIADRYKNSDNLFTMTCRFAEHDDFPWASAWHSTSLSATLTLNGEPWSQIEKDTAENPRAGRSGTLQVLHVSEAAHFPGGGEKSAEKTMLSLLNALADVPQSVAIVETTANGAGGWFYEHWQGAVPFEAFKQGERGNGWIRIFSPWFAFEDSVLPISEAEWAALEPGLTERERAGRTAYGWLPEQVAWRRWTLLQKCAGREGLLDQEYPEDAATAFQTSGRPRFAPSALARLRKRCGEVAAVFGLLRVDDRGKARFEEDAAGWAQIWEPPREGCAYLLWCDTATGRGQTAESADPDCHSILVLRQARAEGDGVVEDAMLVARIRPPCRDDWHLLEEKVIALCLYYGRCLVGVEVPMGLTLLEGLRRAGLPLFRRRSPSGKAEMPGFQCHVGTKPLVIASLSRALDGDPPLAVYDPHVVDELATFVVHDDGREAALPSCHDDDVMALAMAIHHLSQATPYRVRKPGAPPDMRRWKPL